jgi:hypothetical protein
MGIPAAAASSVALLALLAAAPAQGAVTTARLDAEPRAGVVADDDLWVLADRGATRVLIEADRVTGRPTGREAVVATGVPRDLPVLVPMVVRPSIAAAGGALWTPDPVTGDLVRVDPRTATVTARAPLGAAYVAAGPAGLWITGAPRPMALPGQEVLPGTVSRVDPAGARVIGTLPTSTDATVEIAVGRRGLWAARTSPTRDLERVDGPVPARIPGGAWQLSARSGTLHATRRYSCTVTILPSEGPGRSLEMCTRPRALYPRDVARSGGRVWWAAVARQGRPRGVVVSRRASGAGGTSRVAVGDDPVDVVPSGRGVWVLSRSDRTMTRVTP